MPALGGLHMDTRKLLAGAASLLTAALSGCADPPLLYGDHPATSNGTNMPPTVAPDLWMDVYPSGPYGSQPGDILGDIDLPGYRLSVDKTDSSELAMEQHLTLASVRQSYQDAKCIWIQVDAFW